MAFTNSSTDLQDFEQVSGSLSNQRPLLVSVEGNIGSGKSTFLSYCSIKSVYEVCPEPIEKWQDVKGVNLLVNVIIYIHVKIEIKCCPIVKIL